jgi:Fic family protein
MTPSHDSLQKAILTALDAVADPVAPSQLQLILAQAGHRIQRTALGVRLAALRDEGEIEQVGRGRSVRYRRQGDAAWFAVPPEQRPAVPYDLMRLGAYVPNETQWLDTHMREALENAQPARTSLSTYARDVAEKLAVDLSYASSHLEGNTYTYLDTEVLVKYGQAATGKEADETQMILNHKQAVSYLVDICAEPQLSSRTIREFHSLLSQELLDPREVGAIRHRAVSIGGSSYKPLAVPSQLQEEFEKLVIKGNAITNPFEQSLFWMVSLAYLQPFLDVNKRTGRLVCNVPLLREGRAPLSFMSMDKTAYVKGLLEFYELGKMTTIAAAFTQAYVASAQRYDAHLTRDPQSLLIDRQYKREISQIVREWVGVVARQEPDHWEDVVASVLNPITLTPGNRAAIEARSQVMVTGLNEANRIIYGIPHSEYETYLKHCAPAIPRTRRSRHP